MGIFFSFLYGLVAYALCLGTLLYAIGFVGNLFVPKAIDTGAPVFLAEALLVNLLLLGLFAVQQRVMAGARSSVGGLRIVPPAMDRSNTARASLALALMLWHGGRFPSQSSGMSRAVPARICSGPFSGSDGR